MIKIIDNFLTKSYYKNILELLSGPNFEWRYMDNITKSTYLSKPLADPETLHFNGIGFEEGYLPNHYGFEHTFVHQKEGSVSRFTDFIRPLLYQILDVTNCDLIWRARADMVTWSKDDFIYPPHTDFPFFNAASLLYVNESDGDTIFYNVKPTDVPNYKDLKEHKRVSPKPNRLVIFDGNLLHTGCSPTKHKNRILINSNYIKKEDKAIAEES